MNSVKEINVKNNTYYYFDDMINIKSHAPNKIKTDEKLYKNLLIYRMERLAVKYLSYASINSVNPVYLIVNKISECIGETNGNKYLTLFSTDESKDTIKKYEELWNKIRDLIRSITNNSDNYDEKL